MGVNSGSGPASWERLPGYVFRPYHGHHDHGGMAAVRLGCAQRDRIDARSIVEGIPTAAEIAESCAKLDSPSENQVMVEHDGGGVGYVTIRWWQERDGTWLYLHRGYLLPENRGQGIGSAMLDWTECRIRQLVQQHGTSQTAVFGANAMACEQDATTLLLETGYRRVFSLVDATADPTCWRAAWDGEHMAAVALCSIRRHDPTVGEVEELSVRAESRRLGLGRALLLDGLRCLRKHGAQTARLYTGTANPHRSYDLYESVGFQRQNEYVRYRKPIAA
ncbi:GNAT family N-acetyltransferase [Streptomyces sp. NPDC021098]|uniref:GNAT family N-acetyltransferase n=1 Tax=unclassified Streptomyces TaxID=2593676 RepID=UPI0037BBB726